MEIIKETLISQYETQLKNAFNKDPKAIMLTYKPSKADMIDLSVKFKDESTINDKLDYAKGRFLMNMLIPKTNKEVRKKEGTETIRFVAYYLSASFVSSELTLLCEYTVGDTEKVKTYLKKI